MNRFLIIFFPKAWWSMPGNDNDIISIIDVNINRALEGLRVCEDITRFVFQNKKFTTKIKELRHLLLTLTSDISLSQRFTARDVQNDPTKFYNTSSEDDRTSIEDLFTTNIHRVTEAIRSLEESGKLLSLPSSKFQEIRFSLYEIEKQVMSEYCRKFKIATMYDALYAILDSQFVLQNNYAAAAQELIAGGAKIIQLRMKYANKGEILSVAHSLSALCEKNSVLFIVNDHVDIALLSNADGVHLGQHDIPIVEARRILPNHMIIGQSTHSLEELNRAFNEKPDYIAYGPLFDTHSKTGELLSGIGYKNLRVQELHISTPLVAIGGVGKKNILELIKAGFTTFCCISELFANDNITENCKTIVDIIDSKDI